ncbi:hypothetical protein CLAVI_000002 [Candidatus Clavichlamydia salmonicola]|uniref:hypothetical protein n=1 Tax=Candidatus Clavichlamydia salmonicola TaxID=469812 RepID=UPI0018913A1B|nr:hypothetical protein [Candidatus Clavichlamydia salmonicola]MBF5050401.1 hypothetical protein [Candidatus Clavichlamydia salmonicola]
MDICLCILLGHENDGALEARWCKVAHALGMISGALYLLDVGEMYFTNLGIDDNSGNKEGLSVIVLSSLKNADFANSRRC